MSAPDGTVYDVARGFVEEWPVGSGANEMCALGGVAEAMRSDPETPPADTAFWYLVRGRHPCATGSYGDGRITAACP